MDKVTTLLYLKFVFYSILFKFNLFRIFYADKRHTTKGRERKSSCS